MSDLPPPKTFLISEMMFLMSHLPNFKCYKVHVHVLMCKYCLLLTPAGPSEEMVNTIQCPLYTIVDNDLNTHTTIQI